VKHGLVIDSLLRHLKNSLWAQGFADDPVLHAPTDKIEPTHIFGRKFSVGYSSKTVWLDPESELLPNSVTFYTDRSLL
jgi:hypothetical protein